MKNKQKDWKKSINEDESIKKTINKKEVFSLKNG